MFTIRKLAWILRQERGAILPMTLFFFFILISFMALPLLIEQTDLAEMKVQQTADIITKGARTAGAWLYVTPEGAEVWILYATRREAEADEADIVNGAREEAELLYQYNKEQLMQSVHDVEIIHQKGERRSLYRKGIYHVEINGKRRVALGTGETEIKVHRTSQSGIYRNQ